ncbi:hypothetical protein V5799_003797 [Amblyomma americanum]|uniref:Uncharacterized protein n=1 Tax=Amblyomma americanum TaxID=6943 RepID=A0AAQ4D7Y2_AMBAM
MTSKCLLSFRDRSIVLSFEAPWTQQELMEYIEYHDAFTCTAVATLNITVFDEDFGVNIDMPNEFAIEHKAKLKITETSEYRCPGKLYEEAAKALVAKFPVLADATGRGYVHMEFHMITNISLCEKVKSELSHISEKTLEVAGKKRHLEEMVRTVEERLGSPSELEQKATDLLTDHRKLFKQFRT